MKEQKNIERLFQEKFKDFEVAPPEMAWNNIETQLNENKKKRRIVPFWIKASGIAASLFLGFYIYSLFGGIINNDKIEDNTIVVEEKINTIQNQNNSNLIEDNQQSKNNLNQENSVITKVDNSIINNENQKKNSATAFKNKKQNKQIIKVEDNFLATSNKNNATKSNQENQKTDVSNNLDLVKNKIDFDKTNSINKEKNSFIVVDKKTNNTTQDSSLVAKTNKEVNALEQLLKEKEVGKNVEEKEKEMQNRWVVSSNASPVYFNSLSKTSTLDTKFDANDKGYNSNLSYGLGVSFALNNRLSVRTGINTLNFNSSTKDIVFYQRNHPSTIDNLSRNARGSLITVENVAPNDLKEIGFNGGELLKYNGELNQELGYLEVPLELSYKIIDKKFSIDVIGGMSTLFLNNNSVSIISDNSKMEIGSANNLNTIHYSTNFGMGFSYTFFKSFQANINPMVKYQLNTYTDNSNNSKPYFIGLYSGLSYKF